MTKNTVQPPNDRNKDGQGGYAEIHGLKIYYEIHGTEPPWCCLGRLHDDLGDGPGFLLFACLF
jgi:hypothetical protein